MNVMTRFLIGMTLPLPVQIPNHLQMVKYTSSTKGEVTLRRVDAEFGA